MKNALPRWLMAALFGLGILIGSGEIAARDVTVDDDVVRLGDLFEGLSGYQAATAVAKAPAPGKAVTVNPRWLERLARSHGLPIEAYANADTLTVRRQGTIISPREVADIVRNAVMEQTGLDGTDIRLHSGGSPITLTSGSAPALTVENLRFDATDGQFSGTLTVSSDKEVVAQRPISGRALVMVQVPVPTRALTNGAVIGPDDLTQISMATDAVAPNVITDPSSLIGKVAGRSLRAGRPVLQHEIDEPLMVERGRPVTMLFRQSALVISAKGKALEDGSRGDIVRILNTDSGRTVEATVTAPDTVMLSPVSNAPTITARVR